MTPHSTMITIVPIRETFGLPREPTLDEMLSDPIVEAVMLAGGVDQTRLRAMMDRIAGELLSRRRVTLFKPRADGSRSFVFVPHG